MTMWSFDVHLISEFLQFAFEGIVGSELCIFIDGLYVLHVFFGFDLYDGRFPENHNSNNNYVQTSFWKYISLKIYS